METIRRSELAGKELHYDKVRREPEIAPERRFAPDAAHRHVTRTHTKARFIYSSLLLLSPIHPSNKTLSETVARE